MKLSSLITLCMACTAVTSVGAFAQRPLDVPSDREITPAVVRTAPVIDGRLDDACWESAPTATDFRLNTGKGPARCRTEAQICCDAENLYIAVRCEEPETDKLTIVNRVDDAPVWQDDCVEIFIAPNAVASDYFHHFAVNPAGKKAYLLSETPQFGFDWQAAATIGQDAWYAEMAIPFKSLAPIGTNDPWWRINFCRADLMRNEFSSWSEVPQWFKSFWRFGKLMEPKDGPKFTQFRGYPTPVKSEGKPSGARTMRKIPAASEPETLIIPEPRFMQRRSGVFRITPKTRILIGRSDDRMDRRPAEEINQELQRAAGFQLDIQVVGPEQAANTDLKGCIIVGEPWLNPAAREYCTKNGIRVTRRMPGKEGYALEVGEDMVLVSGSDQLGTFWGAQSLRQLIRGSMTGTSATVACLSARDWPQFGYRGVHLLVSPDGLAYHGKMIERVLSRFKVNQIVFECEHVAWDSHPEITNPARAMSKADVRELIRIANDHHITVVPLLQSLGHLEYAFYGKNNLDMAEDPAVPYAYCPLNPKSHEFMADLIDETIELFGHPEYMHMGRDEFDMRGRFPFHEECRKIGREQLYIDDMIWNYAYLKARGIKMMVWGDVLLKKPYEEKIDQLPKDIVICDWHYGAMEQYHSVSYFRDRGFRVIGCTWYNPANLYYFSEDSLRRGAEGMMQTTWTGFMPEARVLDQEFYQIHAYVLGAEWAWSPGAPKLFDLPYEPENVFSKLWFETDSRADRTWFSVDLRPFRNISLVDRKDRIGWLGLDEGNDLSGLPTGLRVMADIPFDLGSDRRGTIVGGPADMLREFGPVRAVTGIPVGRKADKLHFLHTSAYCGGQGQFVGQYVVNYADGTNARVDLSYRNNITSWASSNAASRVGTAWRGRTASGTIVTLNVLAWTNPNPGKEIASIDLAAADSQAAPVLLAVTGEYGKE